MASVGFGEFPDGTIDAEVVSWPIKGHVAPMKDERGWFARFTADDSTTNGDGTVRVHNWGAGRAGAPVDVPFLKPGGEVWFPHTMRVPVGFSLSPMFAGYELHQGSSFGTTGPAVVNNGPAGTWQQIIRGGTNHGLKADPFHQAVFGSTASGWYGKATPWVGGNKPVVEGEEVAFLPGLGLDFTGKGWFQLFAWWVGLDDYREVVPKTGNLFTCFDNTLYPMESLYAQVGEKVSRAIDFRAGRLFDNLTEAVAWAHTANHIGTPPPPPPSPPPPPPPDRFAAARSKVERFRKSSPNIAAAFDETFKALGQ